MIPVAVGYGAASDLAVVIDAVVVTVGAALRGELVGVEGRCIDPRTVHPVGASAGVTAEEVATEAGVAIGVTNRSDRAAGRAGVQVKRGVSDADRGVLDVDAAALTGGCRAAGETAGVECRLDVVADVDGATSVRGAVGELDAKKERRRIVRTGRRNPAGAAFAGSAAGELGVVNHGRCAWIESDGAAASRGLSVREGAVADGAGAAVFVVDGAARGTARVGNRASSSKGA